MNKYVELTEAVQEIIDSDYSENVFQQILNIIESGTRNRRKYKKWEKKVIQLCKNELSGKIKAKKASPIKQSKK
jgi:hypothetical protein